MPGGPGAQNGKGGPKWPELCIKTVIRLCCRGGAKIIVTPLRKLLHMWHVLCSMVSVSLCVLGAPVSYAKTDEPIEMPLEADLCGPKKNHVNEIQIPPREGTLLIWICARCLLDNGLAQSSRLPEAIMQQGSQAATMRSIATITVSTCFIG